MADLKFLKGSSVRFNSLSVKDPDYFYLVSNTDGTIDFYLGDKLIAKGSTIDSLIAEIKARQDGDAELQRQIDTLDLSGALSNLKVSDSPVNGQYISSVSQEGGLISVTRANLPDYSGVYASKSIEDAVSANTSAISILTGTGEGSVSDAVSKGIASVVGGASDAFDTLKEIADYVQSDPQGVVALSNTVTNLSGRMDTAESEIDALQESAKSAHSHSNKALLDTYAQTEESLADAVAKKHEHANLSVLNGITVDNVNNWNSANTYADSAAASAKTEAISQASALASQALTDAENSAALKYQPKGNYESAGAADAALAAAKADAAALYQPKGNYEAAGAAAQALADAKEYADGAAAAAKEYADGAAADALADAKEYADGVAADALVDAQAYADDAAADALAAAKADAESKYALQTALEAEISQRKGLLGSDNIKVEMNSETGIQTIKLIWGEF